MSRKREKITPMVVFFKEQKNIKYPSMSRKREKNHSNGGVFSVFFCKKNLFYPIGAF